MGPEFEAQPCLFTGGSLPLSLALLMCGLSSRLLTSKSEKTKPMFEKLTYGMGTLWVSWQKDQGLLASARGTVDSV